MKDFETDDESSIWPWVTGIVLLAMVIWVAAELSTAEAPTAVPGADVVTSRQAPRPATPLTADTTITPAAFSAWVRDSADVPEWSDDEAFMQAGLSRLAAALGAAVRVTESTELQQRVAALQQSVAGMEGAPTAAADSARAVMMEASAIVAALHERLDASDADSLTTAAPFDAMAGPDPDQPMQRQGVHRYFSAMAESMLAITP